MNEPRRRKKEPAASRQGIKYLENTMPGFTNDWPISDWTTRAAVSLLGALPTVNYARVQMPTKPSAARRKVQFTVVVSRSIYPYLQFHKFYTDKKHRIAGRLWIMRKNLCGYIEAESE